MTTRLYFHAATDGTSGLPSAGQHTTLTSAKDAEGSQTTNRQMNLTIGTSQVQLRLVSLTNINANNYYFTRFVSPPLYQSSIAANTWTWNFAVRESNASANFPVASTNKVTPINCYVWRPGTGSKIGTILQGSSAATMDEATTGITCREVTFTGSEVTGMQDGDVIIFEVWFSTTQGTTTARNDDYFYDGTTANTTDGATVSNHASFLQTPEDLLLFHAEASSIHRYNNRASISATSIHKYALLKPAETYLHSSLNQDTTANTIQYWQITGQKAVSTTKGDVQIVFRTPGVIKNLVFSIGGNSIPNGIIFTLHKNDDDTSLSVAVPGSVTGIFSDDDPTHAVTIAAGDKICVKSVPQSATGTVQVRHQGALYLAERRATTRLATGQGVGFTGASATRYWGIAGQILTSNTSEASAQIKMLEAGTLKNFQVNVTANARTTNTVYTIRKNGSDTPITITVPGGQTGFFEDTSNTESISEDDLVCIKSVTGTGTESIAVSSTAIDFETTSGKGVCVNLMTGGQSHPIDVIGYFAISGQTVQRYTTEAQAVATARDHMLYSKLTIYVTANTMDGDTIFGLRRNNTNAAQTVTIGGGQTGYFTDSTNTDQYAPSDLVDIQIDTNASTTGAIFIRSIVLWSDGSLVASDIEEQSIHKYNKRGLAQQTSIHKSNLLQNIVQQSIHKYWVKKNAFALSIHKYHKRVNIAQQSIHKNNLRQNIFAQSIHKYNLRINALAESIHRYSMRANAFAQSINKYHVYANAEAISQHIYGLLANTLAESIHKTNLLNNISQGSTHRFNKLALATEQSIHKYHKRANAFTTSIHRYSMGGVVWATSTHISNILNNVAQSSTHGLHVHANAAATSIHGYHILALAAAQSIHPYYILALISGTSTHRYNMGGIVSAISTHSYGLLNNITEQSTHRFNLLALATAQSIHKFSRIANVSATSRHIYNVIQVGIAEATMIMKYNILQNVSAQSLHKQNILNNVLAQSIHRFNSLQNAIATSIHKFNAFALVAAESRHRYSSLQNVAATSLHRLNVLQNVSQTSTHIYNLITALVATAQSTHIFNLRANTANTSIHKSNLRHNVSVSSGHTFSVLQNAVALSSHVFRILQNASQTSRHRYRIFSNARDIAKLFGSRLFMDKIKEDEDDWST